MMITATRPAGALDRLLPALVVVLCLVPLAVTPALPSVDFYAHVVRYNVLAHPAAHAATYSPHWTLLPNLGMDILGTAILMLLPPLAAAKVLAAIVILAPVLGTMALSHALHGRVQPLAAALAGLLSYNLILFWGFANFLLGFGIALGSLGWWIARADRPALRLAVMIPVGIVILFIHGLVFGLWGLMLGATELGLALQAGPLRAGDLARRALRLLSLAVLPVLLFLQMRTAGAEGGATGALSNLARIADGGGHTALGARLVEELLKRIDSVLRVAETSVPLVDRLFGLLLWGLLLAGLGLRRLRLDPRLWFTAALCFLLIGLMPPNLFGVGHLDERMPLLFLAVLSAGLILPRPGTTGWIERGLIVLFPVHLLLAIWGLAQAGTLYRDYLAQIAPLDTGALASTAFDEVTEGRDDGRYCKPLLFLLQLTKGTAVPTFAVPTQQPLRLAGPLAEAVRQAPDRGTPLTETVSGLLAAGFDSVVACTSAPAPAIGGTTLAASGPGWAIYQRAPSS